MTEKTTSELEKFNEFNNQVINSNIKTDKFNDAYFIIHKHLVENGQIEESRNGNVYEILNFKTEINNPMIRCVGGKNRNINIFFLLAEALWIWAGRRDVKFLEFFNQQMGEYSDNGTYFHAPYGWRLRNYGVDSNIKGSEENKHSLQGIDQIASAIRLLSNPGERRAVSSIWNPEFDLETKSKDIPCNDMLFWKLRKGKLNLTISNRSNDLDWGLCTNVFQFSFILEVMSKILNVKVGTQTHNSDSLHLYDSNKLTQSIEQDNSTYNLYDNCSTPTIEFNFGDVIDPIKRLEMVDFWVKNVITNLIKVINTGVFNSGEEKFDSKLFEFSPFLHFVNLALETHIIYKHKRISLQQVLERFRDMNNNNQIAYKSDYLLLAMNFYVTRYENNTNIAKMPTLDKLIREIREEIDLNIGKY